MSDGRLERAVERQWQRRTFLAVLLFPLSWLFRVLVACRRLAYRRGWFASAHPGVPVVVVGNVSVGGTGKTPVVAWIAELARAAGRRPAIVSRGYGGVRHDDPVVVTAASDPRNVGDEAVLLARRTALPVVVCTRRVEAARRAVALGADLVIADDGLQHYALQRDLEIVVVDGTRRFGNGWLLPAGPLREPACRLETADLVLCNGEPWTPRMLPFTLRPRPAVSLATAREASPGELQGEVLAVAGIGHPERFLRTLRDGGMSPSPVPVPDHGYVDLARLRAGSPRPIVMTEKDAVKYAGCQDSGVWYLPVDVQVSEAVRASVIEVLSRVLQPSPASRGLS